MPVCGEPLGGFVLAVERRRVVTLKPGEPINSIPIISSGSIDGRPKRTSAAEFAMTHSIATGPVKRSDCQSATSVRLRRAR
jgi:hypothetical protein